VGNVAEQFAREQIPEPERAEDLAALSLGESLDLYAALREQSQQLEARVRALRDRILAVMVQHDLEQVQHGSYEVVRQVRRTPPKLDVERAREILEHHRRLKDCMVETMDVAKARQVLDEMVAAGDISRRDIPLQPGRMVEALIVRPIDLGQPED
jgi:phage shock protein A